MEPTYDKKIPTLHPALVDLIQALARQDAAKYTARAFVKVPLDSMPANDSESASTNMRVA